MSHLVARGVVVEWPHKRVFVDVNILDDTFELDVLDAGAGCGFAHHSNTFSYVVPEERGDGLALLTRVLRNGKIFAFQPCYLKLNFHPPDREWSNDSILLIFSSGNFYFKAIYGYSDCIRDSRIHKHSFGAIFTLPNGIRCKDVGKSSYSLYQLYHDVPPPNETWTPISIINNRAEFGERVQWELL